MAPLGDDGPTPVTHLNDARRRSNTTNRFLIFRAPSRGQGIGAMMNGLAAALLLARQHNRQPCVRWRDFEQGFLWSLPGCPSPDSYFVAQTGSTTALLDPNMVIELWSFGGSMSEAAAASILSSNHSVVVMHGDGGSIAAEAWLDFPAIPRPELVALLSPPSPVVVHLRVGDPQELTSRGLLSGEGAVEQLVRALPSDAFVLTDSEQVHGALCPHFACPTWGVQPHSSERSQVHTPSGSIRMQHTLYTWADWWRVRTATRCVLHTPSAFSESALRFNRAAHSCLLHDLASLTACCSLMRPREVLVPATVKDELEYVGHVTALPNQATHLMQDRERHVEL